MNDSARADERQLQRILTLVRRDIPDLLLIDKRTVWWMRVLGRLVRPFAPDFETNFAMVLGSRVYLPRDPESMDPTWLAATLAHEYVHQLDQQKAGLWFFVSYLLLPIPIWRTHRAYWERRAYAVDMMLAHCGGGDVGLAVVETRLRGLFAGSAYGWMWGGRGAAATYLKPTADEVRGGILQLQSPYVDILRAWTDD